MRILHISETDYEGGGGRAAYAVHVGLRQMGVDSVFLAECIRHRDDATLSVSGLRGFPARLLRHVRSQLDAVPLRRYPQHVDMAWSVGWLRRGILHAVRRLRPDLIHLHWISQVISVQEIGQLGVPIVWTHHAWGAFTGGCHHPGACRLYQTGCGCCPLLRSEDPFDLSQHTCMKKCRAWANARLHSVAVGSGIASDVRRSLILGKLPCLVIPNSVAVDRYRRMEQSVARSQLGLDANAFVVLFGAYSLDKPWKGRAELAQSLEIWRQREPTKNACLATVGLGAMPTLACDLPIKPLGLMKSPEEMARVYSAADVVVVPSHIESFCLVTAEAASCGTPTVAFADTGVADIVRHSETGFLACTRDAGALANGISWASTLSSAARAQVGAQCRDVCVSRFSSEKVATAHIELYNQILADGGLLQ